VNILVGFIFGKEFVALNGIGGNFVIQLGEKHIKGFLHDGVEFFCGEFGRKTIDGDNLAKNFWGRVGNVGLKIKRTRLDFVVFHCELGKNPVFFTNAEFGEEVGSMKTHKGSAEFFVLNDDFGVLFILVEDVLVIDHLHNNSNGAFFPNACFDGGYFLSVFVAKGKIGKDIVNRLNAHISEDAFLSVGEEGEILNGYCAKFSKVHLLTLRHPITHFVLVEFVVVIPTAAEFFFEFVREWHIAPENKPHIVVGKLLDAFALFGHPENIVINKVYFYISFDFVGRDVFVVFS